MKASAWPPRGWRRKAITGSALRWRISATAGLAASDSDTMIRRRSAWSWSRSIRPGQLPDHQAGVRDSHFRPLGKVGDAERPADRQHDQHANMTLAELASVPEHGRDFSSPALVGEDQLRQQRPSLAT